jgi:hypothetical protein
VPTAPVFGLLGITLNALSLAKDIANAFFTAALDLFGSGASALVSALLGFVSSTSDPGFSGGWWSASGQAVFTRVVAVSASLLALAFMCSIITALISADHALLARAAIRLPCAVIAMALLVGVTAALVAASDEISVEVASGATQGLATFAASGLATAISGAGIVGLIGGGLVVLAGLVVWVELLCRSALIYLAVMAGPLIFAASVHPSVRGLQRRYVEGALALIASKIVIALAFATGSAMLSGLGSSPSFAAATGALLEALAILVIAAFAPFVLLKLLLGAEGIVAAEGLERRPARAALGAIGAVSAVGGFAMMTRGLISAGSAASSAGVGSVVTPPAPTSGGTPGSSVQGSAPTGDTARPASHPPASPILFPPSRDERRSDEDNQR